MSKALATASKAYGNCLQAQSKRPKPDKSETPIPPSVALYQAFDVEAAQAKEAEGSLKGEAVFLNHRVGS